ncbi:MAG: hypothetical protein LDL41_24115 [Coleofasciculus sp. S288]|nr:hypothetical protein [Coleofasciculus sp. S288]
MTTQKKLEVQDTQKATENNQLYDYPRRDLQDIQVYLERVLEIIELESFDTAVCSAVFIAEAVMRSFAEHHSIDFESKTPKELAHTFHEQSLMSQEDYQILTKAIDIRDAVMHKGEKIAIDSGFARRVVEVVQHLFSQLSLALFNK